MFAFFECLFSFQLLTALVFVFQDILSDFDELSDWRMHNLPTDLHAVQNALIMRVSSLNRRHCWPLLLDMDNQAEMWVKALQSSKNAFTSRDVAEQDEQPGQPIFITMIDKYNSMVYCRPTLPA